MYPLLLLSIFYLIPQCSLTSAAPENLRWSSLEDARAEQKEIEDVEFDKSFFEDEWQHFKITYGKIYKNVTEELRRKDIFAKTLKEIEEHNKLFSKGIKSFTLGVNQFSDLEHSEFLEQMTCSSHTEPDEDSVESVFEPPLTDLAVPKEVDWRKSGYVTEVKNQGSCGSCWAFAATGALEGQHFRKTRKFVSLSEQNLIDCSDKFGNKGCKGGWTIEAFRYIEANGGIDIESAYPYEGKLGNCRYSPFKRGATCKGYAVIRSRSERDLQIAVATIGPISVSLDASPKSFHQYKNGVYDDPECKKTSTNHAVLVVGYGTTAEGKKYWIVKNSWGNSWGLNGYIYIARNRNQCGITKRPSYPIV